MAVADGVDDGGEEGVTRAEQLSRRFAFDLDKFLLEGDPFVNGLQWGADLGFPFRRAHSRRDPCDLEPASLAFGDPTAEQSEGFKEERSDEPRLQLASLGPFHHVTDLIDPGFGEDVNRQSTFGYHILEPFADVLVDYPHLPGLHFRVVPVADRFDQKVTQRTVDERITEHVVDLITERLSHLLDLGEEPIEDCTLPGFIGNHVPQVADLFLAYPVDTPETLLDPVRVPREVVVDHQVGPLQIDTLSGSVGRHQDLNVRVGYEGVLSAAPILSSKTPMDDTQYVWFAEEAANATLQI